MDILARLRLILWLMVFSLWGLMLYQLVEKDGAPPYPRMQWIHRSFSMQPAKKITASPSRLSGNKFFPARQKDKAPSMPKDPSKTTVSPRTVPRTWPGPKAQVDETVPSGFIKTQTPHFTVYSEGEEASEAFLQTLENLHGNLILDLIAFSPWARDERVEIFLFRTQHSYRRVTGRPSWSGGASSIKRRKIYLYESEEWPAILAHELCHLYFDSFFPNGSPLWLSEGMATLIQTERGLAAPHWLKENLEILRRGGGYSFHDLTRVENTLGAEDEQVHLWYTQAYSVVRFLIRSHYRSSFYHFCQNLRDGQSISNALHRAYGLPFRDLQDLEKVWRHDLQSGKILSTSPSRLR